ncbi:glycosyltransferase family 4 protein [Cupriavidus oxalaticus]|uniref:Glycosyltransferase family 1 protein n=1 Tax=Cupriavidus oxalaticus TaxID=96344 RepID=A0A5P3VFC4_9BURK|nr:glycosyltransferase family 4 protein [Cupriavidus oxalaticus]QEZ44072.1 glycosyltransferase family 1 protein [Cupriavidus oxalaticus]
MPKILIVTTVPETVAVILREQPRFLRQHYDVEVVTSPGDACRTIADSEGVRVHALHMERGISVLRDGLSVLSMIRVLRRARPDLVHSYTPKAGLVAMLAGWSCRVPVRVHTFTGLIFPSSRGLRQQLLIWADRLICACATHVVPEGNGVRHDLQRYRITSKPLQVIGFGNIAGIDTAHFSRTAAGVEEAARQLRARLGIGDDAFVFCFIGRLNRDKGLPELAAAFAGMPARCHLLLVGGLDAIAPPDACTLRALRAHPRVHEIGFVDDVRPALRASDVLVLPSYREGFPNVMLQAGAMTLPVVASDINGCNEVIETGQNGWLVPPRDTDALTGAMQQAEQAGAVVRDRMGEAARRRIATRFERREHWERLRAFYRGLLQERSAAGQPEPAASALTAESAETEEAPQAGISARR